MISNPATLTHHHRFTELFELACMEPDQDKLGALFEEILRLLDSQTMQIDRSNPDRKPRSTEASAQI